MLYLFTFIAIDRKGNPKLFIYFLTFILLQSSISAALKQNPTYVAITLPPRGSY